MPESTTTLTHAEIKNGWTAETLAAYRRERDAASDLVPGNVVTEFKRPKLAPKLEGALKFNAHKW